jgi:hypothetical protein
VPSVVIFGSRQPGSGVQVFRAKELRMLADFASSLILAALESAVIVRSKPKYLPAAR